MDFIEKNKKIILIASFISICTLISIAINYFKGTNGLELTIVIFAVSIFAIISPIICYIDNKTSFKENINCFIMLLFLYIEVFIWLILFNGFKALPKTEHLLFFAIPFLTFWLIAISLSLYKHFSSKS